jgi:hypothetical protein
MNGTAVRIVSIGKWLVTVYNYTTGELDDIPRINFQEAIVKNSPLMLNRKQFPLRPRYSMTTNMCQGKNITRLLLDLRHDPFAHGQLHVGCSRVNNSKCIRALTLPERIFNNRARTVNVVYPELLQ